MSVEEDSEKVITNAGKTVTALIGADRLDDRHALERERMHVLLLEDVNRGLADLANWRTEDADVAIARLQQRRKTAAKTGKLSG